MKKIMLLLTRKYPYSFGEPFLENELPKHVPYYDKILVLSQDVSKGEEATRVLPGGVEAVITATSSRNKLRRQDVFRLLPSFLLGNERIRKERQSRKVNVVQKMFLCYLDARCQRLIREAQGATSNIDFKQYEQITIYSYWFFANAVVAVALKKYLREKLNFRGRIVLISRAHRYDIYEEANSIKYLPFRKFLLDEIDYVFPCSQDGTEYLHRKYFKTKAKIETAYLGTKDYGLSSASQSGVFHLVSCSRVVKVKGLERLIDALAQLKIDQYKVLWTHIGGGVEGKNRYFDFIQSYAKRKLENISFEFLGSMPNEKVYEYYKQSKIDVFVNVSYSEGLPVSLMEASSFGIPVIATDVGGSKEIIVENHNGYLLETGFTSKCLAKIIQDLMEMPAEEIAKKRTFARNLWEQKYNAERNYKEFASRVSEL